MMGKGLFLVCLGILVWLGYLVPYYFVYVLNVVQFSLAGQPAHLYVPAWYFAFYVFAERLSLSPFATFFGIVGVLIIFTGSTACVATQLVSWFKSRKKADLFIS
jgi:hypothetical protein